MDKRREMEAAADQIEELFADLWQVFPFARGARRGYRPQADVFRTNDSLVVHVELPGVEPDQVKLIVGQRGLLITGERRRSKEHGQVQQMEIAYGPFQREIPLGEDVDPDQTTATYKRGILRVTLPLAPRPVARESVSITVRTG